MNQGTNDKESDKIHGDKLDSPAQRDQHATTPKNPADLLEIPPHEQPQNDGGTKIHGDKLEPHGGEQR